MNDLAAAADEYALGNALGDEWQWVRVEVVASTEVFDYSCGGSGWRM